MTNAKIALNDRLIVVMSVFLGTANISIVDWLMRVTLTMVINNYVSFKTYLGFLNIVIFSCFSVWSFVCLRRKLYGKGFLLMLIPLFVAIFELHLIGTYAELWMAL